jgi:ribosomal protein S18 acetylase RimI-like enzyme
MNAPKQPLESLPQIAVRSATGSDARAIARVHVDSWRDVYAGILPTERLVRMSVSTQTKVWTYNIFRSGVGSPVLVAEDPEDGRVVAFSSGGRARRRARKGQGEIYTLYVDPDCQNRGIGSTLLQAMRVGLAKAGYAQAIVWVLAENPSRFFYEAMGGKLDSSTIDRFWGADRVELAYVWDSPPCP